MDEADWSSLGIIWSNVENNTTAPLSESMDTLVKWHKTDVHGWLQNQHSPSTTFIMPPTPVRLVAISAKIEAWFPIIEGNEEIDTWLLLPRPANETDRKRFPHRVRVSIYTGDTQDFDMMDALNNMSVQLGWFPTQQGEGIWHSNELVKYWDNEDAGSSITRDTALPTSLFEETSHGVFEATVWFARKSRG